MSGDRRRYAHRLPRGSDAVSVVHHKVPADRHPMSCQRGNGNGLSDGDHAMSGGDDPMPGRTGQRDDDPVPPHANSLSGQYRGRRADAVPGRNNPLPCQHNSMP